MDGGRRAGELPADRPHHPRRALPGGDREAVARDPRAGLLVSLHGQGLYEGRRGLDPGPPTPRAERPPAVQAFLAEQDGVQADLRRRIGGGPALDAWAWAGYRLLQTWDVLSLYLTWRGAGGAGASRRCPRCRGRVGDPGVSSRCGRTAPRPHLRPVALQRRRGWTLPVAARMVEDRPLRVGRGPPGGPAGRSPLGDPPAPRIRARQSSWYLNETESRRPVLVDRAVLVDRHVLLRHLRHAQVAQGLRCAWPRPRRWRPPTRSRWYRRSRSPCRRCCPREPSFSEGWWTLAPRARARISQRLPAGGATPRTRVDPDGRPRPRRRSSVIATRAEVTVRGQRQPGSAAGLSRDRAARGPQRGVRAADRVDAGRVGDGAPSRRPAGRAPSRPRSTTPASRRQAASVPPGRARPAPLGR